jgi:hypothetical protein
MAQAQGSQKRVTYIKETAFGVTPTTPQMQAIEFRSFDGNLNASTLQSESIRDDRNVADARRGNYSAQGTLAVELTADNYDEFLSGVMQAEWATDELKIGKTPKSYTFEEGYTDIGQFRTFTGMVPSSLSLEVGADSYVTASFNFVGKDTSAFSTTSVDSTPTAVAAKTKLYHEGGTFKVGGSVVGYLTGVTLSLDNSATPNNTLGSTGARSITTGNAKVTGQVSGLFETPDLYNNFVNNVDSSIEFTLTDGTDTLTFFVPKAKFTNGRVVASGDAGVTVELDYSAVLDATEATSLVITRA